MNVKPCRPYHARTAHRELLRLPDGRSAYKVYFVSITGREDPARYEWEHCGRAFTDVCDLLCRQAPPGVGFITAFTHITKVFRFAPAGETVLHVRAFHTGDLSPLDLARDDGFSEFACYAEAAIAADEYHCWARVRDVASYLKYFSDFTDGPVASHRKLGEYYQA